MIILIIILVSAGLGGIGCVAGDLLARSNDGNRKALRSAGAVTLPISANLLYLASISSGMSSNANEVWACWLVHLSALAISSGFGAAMLDKEESSTASLILGPMLVYFPASIVSGMAFIYLTLV